MNSLLGESHPNVMKTPPKLDLKKLQAMMSQSHNVINSKIGPCLMKLDVVEQQIWTKFIQFMNCAIEITFLQ